MHLTQSNKFFENKLKCYLNKKLKYAYLPEKKSKAFMGFFAMEPWLFDLLTNVILLFVLTAIGFGIIYAVNLKQSKLYGEHCNTDDDCKSNQNLVCQSGKCSCSSTTFFDSTDTLTGKCGNHHLSYIVKQNIINHQFKINKKI